MTSKEQAAMSETRRLKVFASKGATRRLTGIGFADTAEGVVDYLGGMWADEIEALANARRLVASWNACRHIPTAELEKYGVLRFEPDVAEETPHAKDAKPQPRPGGRRSRYRRRLYAGAIDT